MALRELLAETASRVAKKEAELAELRVEQRGLELAYSRLNAGDDWSVAESRPVNSESAALPRTSPVSLEEWQKLGKTERVERILERATKPLGPAEIVDILNSVGLPQKDSETVRGALAYLKRRGKATFLNRSQWVLVDGAVHQRHQQAEKREPTSTDTGTSSMPAGAVQFPIHHSIMVGEDHAPIAD